MRSSYQALILTSVLLGIAGCGGGGESEPAPPPTLEFSASPQSIFDGQSSTLIWMSSNVSRCTATGDWSGSRASSGSEATEALASTAIFVLSCTGAGGTVQRNTTVEVFPAPDPPQSIQAAFGDGRITVSWQSLAGNFYAGYPVTTNIYVSTSPNIDVGAFSESPSNRVMRGLTTLQTVVFRDLVNGIPVYIVATDVVNGIEGAPSQEISVTPQPVPPLVENIAALNDTGVSGCTDLSILNLSCPVASLPNQDADRGRDAAARNGELAKTGFGSAGFDFTKLDTNGDPLPDDAPAWTCVRDNVTGLIWEVPADSGLTSALNFYTWYQPDPLLNGGNPGQPDGGSCTGSQCDTDAFIKALNAASLCGFQDWRLPTRRELFSLADFSRSRPAIADGVFPNLPHYDNAFFWTSTTTAATATVGFGAWAMSLVTGQLVVKSKWLINPGDVPGFILAVRAGATP